jgi:8-oxo-dGTP diphosphatase
LGFNVDVSPHLERLARDTANRDEQTDNDHAQDDPVLNGRSAAPIAKQGLHSSTAAHRSLENPQTFKGSHSIVKDRLNEPSHSTDGAGPIWVSAVALISSERRVLVQQRPEASQHGMLWEFPGGKLEAGESPERAAVRELAEELAITIEPENLVPVGFASGTSQSATGSRPLVILLFACRVWDGDPVANAATKLAWCDPNELGTWRMPPLDYPLVHALTKMPPEFAF